MLGSLMDQYTKERMNYVRVEDFRIRVKYTTNKTDKYKVEKENLRMPTVQYYLRSCWIDLLCNLKMSILEANSSHNLH